MATSPIFLLSHFGAAAFAAAFLCLPVVRRAAILMLFVSSKASFS